MLRPVLLCLAAWLASICAQPQLQVPPRMYSYRVVYNDHAAPTRTYRVWYDSVNRRTRVDTGDGQAKVVWYGRSDEYPFGVATVVSPITTEVLLNAQVCTNVSNEQSSAIDGLYSFLDPIILRIYQLVGKEELRDEVVEKWGVVCPCPRYVAQDNYYFAYRELHGVRQYVGVRRHLQLWSDDLFTPHEVMLDIYDYDTSDIDPEIFNIQKGLTCDMEVGEEGKRILRQHLHAYPYRNLHAFKEDRRRREITRENMELIEEHNRGNHSYKLAVNHRVIDRTEDEVKEMLSERVSSEGPNNALPFPYTDEEIESLSAELPEHFDWRNYKAVTPSKVTSYYSCNVGWANAAVGAVEGALIVKNNFTRRARLSEQPILDCSWGFGNRGCASGLEVYAFDWMKKYGLPSELQYGKFEMGSYNCRINEVEWDTSITDYVKVKPDENALRLAIVKHGPVTVRLGFTWSMTHYTNGIYDDPNCSQEPDDYYRTALVVGYGTLDGRKYWLVRDVFGADYGVDGHVLYAAGDNTCGILNNAYYVII